MQANASRLPTIPRLGCLLVELALGLLFVAFLFMLLASQFSWVRTIYDQIPFLAKPELRIHEYGSSQHVHLNTEWWIQRVIVVKNHGNKTSGITRINVFVPNGRITRYQIASDEPYIIGEETSIQSGYLKVLVTQLPPDAKVMLYLWAVQPATRPKAEVDITAVHRGGAASTGDVPTPIEEFRSQVSSLIEALGIRLNGLERTQ